MWIIVHVFHPGIKFVGKATTFTLDANHKKTGSEILHKDRIVCN